MSESQRLSVEEFTKEAERLYNAFNSRELITRLRKDQLQRLFDIMTLTLRPFHIDMSLYHGRATQPLQPLTLERNTAACMMDHIRHLILERREDLSWEVYFTTQQIADSIAPRTQTYRRYL